MSILFPRWTGLALLLPSFLLVGALAGCRRPIPTTTAKPKPGAPPPPIAMNVTVGQNNLTVRGLIAPVTVTLDSTGIPRRGRLELVGRNGRVTRMPYELPKGGHKVYTLFAQFEPDLDSQDGSCAELFITDGDRPMLRHLIKPEFVEGPVYLSCTGDGSGLQFLAQEKKVFVSHRTPVDMPREWGGFRPCTAVAVNGRAWSEMDDAQRRAMRLFVARGGRAILCGESPAEWRDTDGRWLSGVTPTDLRAVASLSGVADWAGVPMTPRSGKLMTVSGPVAAGGQVQLAEGGRALALTRPFGSGRILWLGFDPFRAAVREWPGNIRFWRQALVILAKGEYVAPFGESSPAAARAATTLPRLPAPPPWAIAGFGVVYVVIFGGLNTWLLRRLRRTVRAWAVTPVLAVTVSVVALSAGQFWGSAQVVMNQVNIISTTAGASAAVEVGLTGLFSPTNRDFDLRVDDSSPSFAERREETPSGVHDMDWPTEQADGVSRWLNVALQIYSVRQLRLVRPVDLGGPITAALQRPPGSGRIGFTGTVSNTTSLELNDAALYCQGWRVGIGKLAAGATARVDAEGWKRGGPGRKPDPLLSAGSDGFGPSVARLIAEEVGDGDPTQPAGVWLVALAPRYRAGIDVAGQPITQSASTLVVRLDP